MLSGNWPYYNGDHIPDPLLSDRVEYCGTEVSLVEQVHTKLLYHFNLTIFYIPNLENIESNFCTLKNVIFSIRKSEILNESGFIQYFTFLCNQFFVCSVFL